MRERGPRGRGDGEGFPEELMIQAAPLEALARAQALGGPFYGAAVLPPWQRPGWEIPADAREAIGWQWGACGGI